MFRVPGDGGIDVVDHVAEVNGCDRHVQLAASNWKLGDRHPRSLKRGRLPAKARQVLEKIDQVATFS
jgi:hypothetical protein